MAKAKILIIEDEEVLSRVLAEEFQDEGFEVYQAFDGEEGLKMVESRKPDLVLLDIILPKINGFQVLEQIKRSPETNTVPVVIMTMLGADEDIKKGLKLGAADYIVKPQHAMIEIIDKVKSVVTKTT